MSHHHDGIADPRYEERRIVLGHDRTEALAHILPALRRGGVILLPADTIYGLSCRWDSLQARERIQALKGPARLSMFVALVANQEMALHYALPPRPAGMRILEEHWPGPVTAVLTARPDRVPEFCVSPEGTVAFRWPGDPFLQELVRDLGVPLVSTSANRTGEEHALSAEEAWRLFGTGVDIYVDGGRLENPPSTLVDLTGEEPELLRLGPAAGSNAPEEPSADGDPRR